MKRIFFIILATGLVVLSQVSLTSCRGKAASKTIEAIEKAASKGGKKAGKVLKYGDDVYRAVDKHNSSPSSTTPTKTAATYQCPSCAGYGKVNFVDEYGNYAYTGICPDCNGEGTITKFDYD